MKLAPNGKYRLFVDEIRKLKRPFGKWCGLLFRASPLQYAQSSRLLNGMGSYRWGGRWSAPGASSAVNTSVEISTAFAESGASFSYYNWKSADVRPKVIIALRVQFSKIMDLTSGSLTRGPGIELKELMQEDWHKINAAGFESLTQAFGRAAHDCGAEGLLVPSAQVPGGSNLVYFPESLAKGSKIELLGQEELDRWIKKK